MERPQSHSTHANNFLHCSKETNALVVKAVRKALTIGSLSVEAFQLPDGSYRLSQTSTAKAIKKAANNFVQIREGKSPEGSQIKGLNIVQIQLSSAGRPSNGIEIEDAVIYWQYWADRGNAQAKALITALATEALERRLDDAFGVARTTEAGLPYGKNVPEPKYSEVSEKRAYNAKTAHQSWQIINGILWHCKPGTDTWEVDVKTPNYADYCLWRQWYPRNDLPLEQAVKAFELIKSEQAA